MFDDDIRLWVRCLRWRLNIIGRVRASSFKSYGLIACVCMHFKCLFCRYSLGVIDSPARGVRQPAQPFARWAIGGPGLVRVTVDGRRRWPRVFWINSAVSGCPFQVQILPQKGQKKGVIHLPALPGVTGYVGQSPDLVESGSLRLLC